MLVAVSAGSECEAKARECWQDGKPDEYFFLEMYGSAVVEFLVTHAAGRVCAWAEQNGMAVLPALQPRLHRLAGVRPAQVLEPHSRPQRFAFPRRTRSDGQRHVAAQKIVAHGFRPDPPSGKSPARLETHSLRKLFAAELPISPRALPLFHAADWKASSVQQRDAGSVSLRNDGFPLDLNAHYSVNCPRLAKMGAGTVATRNRRRWLGQRAFSLRRNHLLQFRPSHSI